MNKKTNAFTLVELLVVVAIIVVLLALMIPALDKAIYQAELTVCGTKLKAIGGGVNLYAMENKRLYPDRPAIDEKFNIRPDYLHLKGPLANEAAVIDFDEREALAPFMAINATLNCPLAAAVDLEIKDSDLPTGQAWVYTNYALWYDFRFVVQDQPETAMRKLGDRMSWTDKLTNPSSPTQHKFSVLADDSDSIDNGSWVMSSHPDNETGMLSNQVTKNELEPSTGFYVTGSFWTHRDGDNSTRGPIDRNFAYADGSVLRLTGLKLDDERMVAVPDRSSATGWGNPGRRRWLPKGQ